MTFSTFLPQSLLVMITCLLAPGLASAQLSDGQGVLVDCHVNELVFNQSRAQFTCDTAFFNHDELRANVELRFDQSNQNSNELNLWTIERTVDLMASAPRDESDRPVLRFNLMYLETRIARIMDVRAVWSENNETASDPDNRFARVMRDRLDLGAIDPRLATSSPTPDDFQGLVMACHVDQIVLYPELARFTCADGHNPDWSGLDDQIDIRYDQSSSHKWMAERTIDLMVSAPRDASDKPILHFNIMYRGSGSPAYAMDVRTHY